MVRVTSPAGECGYIIKYLFSWHHSFDASMNNGSANKRKGSTREAYNRKHHFITREAFQDTLTCVNYFVNIVRLKRDGFPLSALQLAYSGSQPCEDWFSWIGGWGKVRSQIRGVTIRDCISMIRKNLSCLNSPIKFHFDTKNNYSYESKAMLDSEKAEGYTSQQIFSDVSEFSDAKISTLLEEGASEAVKDVNELLHLNLKEFKCDYSVLRSNDLASEKDMIALIESKDDDNANLNEDDAGEAVNVDGTADKEDEDTASSIFRDFHTVAVDVDESEELEDPHLREEIERDRNLLKDLQEMASDLDPKEGGSDNEKQEKGVKGFILKSESDGAECDAAIACSIFTSYLGSSSIFSKDRDAKIVQASKMKREKLVLEALASSNPCLPRGKSNLGTPDDPKGGQYLHSGKFVAVLFMDDKKAKDGLRIHWCKVWRIVYRPKGKKPQLWRRGIPLDSLSSDIFILGQWLEPVAGIGGYDEFTTPYLKFRDPDIKDTFQEFSADKIICAPEITECYDHLRISDIGMKAALDYLENIRNQLAQSSTKPTSDTSFSSSHQPISVGDVVLCKYEYAGTGVKYCPAEVVFIHTSEQKFDARFYIKQASATGESHVYAFKVASTLEVEEMSMEDIVMKLEMFPHRLNNSKRSIIKCFKIDVCDESDIDVVRER